MTDYILWLLTGEADEEELEEETVLEDLETRGAIRRRNQVARNEEAEERRGDGYGLGSEDLIPKKQAVKEESRAELQLVPREMEEVAGKAVERLGELPHESAPSLTRAEKLDEKGTLQNRKQVPVGLIADGTKSAGEAASVADGGALKRGQGYAALEEQETQGVGVFVRKSRPLYGQMRQVHFASQYRQQRQQDRVVSVAAEAVSEGGLPDLISLDRYFERDARRYDR